MKVVKVTVSVTFTGRQQADAKALDGAIGKPTAAARNANDGTLPSSQAVETTRYALRAISKTELAGVREQYKALVVALAGDPRRKMSLAALRVIALAESVGTAAMGAALGGLSNKAVSRLTQGLTESVASATYGLAGCVFQRHGIYHAGGHRTSVYRSHPEFRRWAAENMDALTQTPPKS